MQEVRNPIDELRQMLTRPQYISVSKVRKGQIIRQCELVVSILCIWNKQLTLPQAVTATKAVLRALGQPAWFSEEHELFVCILLNASYIRVNKDMHIVVS